MARVRASMQELIQRRRRAGFVGRRHELAVFRANFGVPPEDERHRFVFHVHGNGGVGKSWLLRQLEQVARQEHGALTACLDESVNSVPEAMAAISAQFAQQGHELTALDRRLATYRQRRHEAEAAPLERAAGEEGTPPAPSAGSMAAARAGIAGLGVVPVVGAVAGAVDPVPLAQGADRLRAALSSRFRDHRDVQLVLDPVEVLTPLLVKEVSRAAAEVPWTVLFFDTYERTGPVLDPWLRALLTSESHGTLPAHTVIVLAGRDRLDPGCWADLAEVVGDVPLEPFTDAEARQLLAGKGVTDEAVVRDVLRLSGRLPVLVSTLAEHPGAVDDPSATAVERFLKWEDDPVRRAAALAGALPRRLDDDVFRAAVDEDAAELFGWLRSLPFVSEHAGSARYHQVVRAPMLRLQQNTSPRRWATGHLRLAETFAGWRESAEEETGRAGRWKRDDWCSARLEETYHLLCARPTTALPEALRDGIGACEAGPAVARRWATMLAEAGEDAGADAPRDWGRRLLAALADERRRGIEALGLLLAGAGLDPADRAAALVVRGGHRHAVAEYAEALEDFGQALALDPGCWAAHVGRAVVHRATGDTDGAMAELDRAEALAPDSARIPRERGETFRRARRHEEALAQLDRVVAADPSDASALSSRGQTKAALGRPREALADLDRAIALRPDYTWALVRRAHVRSQLRDTEGALDDLDRARALDPDIPGVLGERGDVCRLAGRYEEAIVAYDGALALDPGYAWALGSRALAQEALGRRAEALADLDRAVELNPGYAWAVAQRERIIASAEGGPGLPDVTS